MVTAERRAVDIQTTPIAITAISGSELQSLHLDTLSSLQTTVPGVQINDQGGGFYNFVNIRGIGATLASPTVQPGVALFRDGILQGDSADNSTPMYDIRDTEVLKGPQGTLIGATSIGGAIEINSEDPNFRGVNGYALAGLGNYSD
ncbi:MAG: TonB-dependent receptor plug domain-containing protein, partial [Steroidobacteraceae bacterium]